MNTKYIDLINQTFDFPQQEFSVDSNKNLHFQGIDTMKLVEEFGTPLKFTYLPKISENIQNSKKWFQKTMKKNKYKGKYYYCYCTKSSHFKHVLDEALKNDIHIETSSAVDIDIIESLKKEGKIPLKMYILCNGFKRDEYIKKIQGLIQAGHKNCIPIIDNYEEIGLLTHGVRRKFNIGIRIASEEDPKFEFYTSRLGIGYKNIVDFYRRDIKENKKVSLKMLHL